MKMTEQQGERPIKILNQKLDSMDMIVAAAS